MSTREVRALIGVVVGAILGGVGGYLVGGSPVYVAVCASLSAVLGGVIALTPLSTLLSECCLNFVVPVIACVGMIAAFLLWHSLFLAALAGVGMMTVVLVVLSAWVRSYKDATAVQ